jgi:protein-S-isoprenylcysteine O-methyltransferase Ste14
VDPRTRKWLGWAAVGAQFVAIVAIVWAGRAAAPAGAAMTALGLALMLAGLVVMLLAFRGLGPALTATPVPRARAGLRTSGLYARVRHPIYTGLLLLMGGVIVRGPDPAAVAWFVVLAALLTVKALWEERMLAREYPAYSDYMRTTGRFLPRLRPARVSG